MYIGLIHANHGLAITDYLSKELRNNSNEVGTAHCNLSGLLCSYNMTITYVLPVIVFTVFKTLFCCISVKYVKV